MGRHETFENAAPLAEVLLAGTALGLQSDPDAALMHLWQQRDAAVATVDAVSARLDAIARAIEWPQRPTVVYLREGDEALGLAKYCITDEIDRLIYPCEQAQAERRGWRRQHFRWVTRPTSAADGLPNYVREVTIRELLPQTQARADEIAEAWDRHQVANATVTEASGLDAADKALEAADDAVNDVELAIIGAAAKTFAGLVIKARLAQAHLDEDISPHPNLIAGLVRDIIAMAAAA